MTCFVIVGCKTGDVLSALPIIHHAAITTKERPAVMIARQYASILERVPYVTPMIFNGDWQDLKGALRLAKRHSSRVVCLSTYGREFPVEHRTSSFVLDQYDRAGILSLWDKLPLVIEYKPRLPFGRPTILFADHSQSSPFLHKQDLHALLVESFPSHQIIRLSDIKLPHICDFVGWFDQADALVTIETVHLHLSAATTKPVFAWAADKPSKWSGSAWSKRFSFFGRYGEFEERKTEMVEAIKDTLAGIRKPEPMVLN